MSVVKEMTPSYSQSPSINVLALSRLSTGYGRPYLVAGVGPFSAHLARPKFVLEGLTSILENTCRIPAFPLALAAIRRGLRVRLRVGLRHVCSCLK